MCLYYFQIDYLIVCQVRVFGIQFFIRFQTPNLSPFIPLNAQKFPRAPPPPDRRLSSDSSLGNSQKKFHTMKRHSPSLIIFLQPHFLTLLSGSSSHQAHFLQRSFSLTPIPSGSSPTWATHCPASTTFRAQVLKPSRSPIKAHP